MLWGGRLWRHPDFLKLWSGQVGSQLTVLALPTVAHPPAAPGTIFWGAWPLANMIGGVLGASIGPVPTILLGGSVGLFSAVAIAIGPIGRLRRHPAPAN